MNMMKAAVVHAFGQPLEIQEVPVPDVAPGQVLVNLDNINAVFDRMKLGDIEGRIVMRIDSVDI